MPNLTIASVRSYLNGKRCAISLVRSPAHLPVSTVSIVQSYHETNVSQPNERPSTTRSLARLFVRNTQKHTHTLATSNVANCIYYALNICHYTKFLLPSLCSALHRVIMNFMISAFHFPQRCVCVCVLFFHIPSQCAFHAILWM